MNEKRFNELYLNTQFKNYAVAIIKSIYNQYKQTFQDNSIDFEDLEQECWMALFERADNDKDKSYCHAVIKNAAIDFLRSMNKELDVIQWKDHTIEDSKE